MPSPVESTSDAAKNVGAQMIGVVHQAHQTSPQSAAFPGGGCDFSDHIVCRGLKVAALAIISNLAVTDDNRTACSKLRFVPRLVALLDSSVPADVSSMAVSALAQLVLLDVNRLKCWRCGGVERLKAIVDRNLPRVSEVARQAVQVGIISHLQLVPCDVTLFLFS
jgi:hypothetical protein